MWLTFLVSYIGFLVLIRMNSLFVNSIGTSEKKLSVFALFFSLISSFLAEVFAFSSLFAWMMATILILSSPLATIYLKKTRERQVPQRCLMCIDHILLILKAGGSLRSAIDQIESAERSWFKSFLGELRRSIQFKSQTQTNSKWFKAWSREISEIELSQVKTIDQLEALRRQIRSEIYAVKKISQVTSGPRFQVWFMSALFIALNIYTLGGGIDKSLRPLLILAWILFISGILVTLLLMRSIKWKI